MQRPAPRRAAGTAAAGGEPAPDGPAADARPPPTAPIRLTDLDRTDLELIQIILNEPAAVDWLIAAHRRRRACGTLRCGRSSRPATTCRPRGNRPGYENLMVRLEDPAVRALATDLIASTALSMPEPAPFSEGVRPAPWQERLERMLIVLDERERQARLKDLKKALEETDPHADPDAYRAIELEYRRLLTSGRTRKT